MTEIIRETVTTQGETPNPIKVAPVEVKATKSQTAEYLIYFVFGLLEILLAFRIVFKLAGANPGSSFVNMIYGLTGIFVMPFEGIFRRAVAQGVETTSVLEPSAMVAIVVYALLAWGIVKLVGVLSGNRQEG